MSHRPRGVLLPNYDIFVFVAFFELYRSYFVSPLFSPLSFQLICVHLVTKERKVICVVEHNVTLESEPQFVDFSEKKSFELYEKL